jgi:hypothetical protein
MISTARLLALATLLTAVVGPALRTLRAREYSERELLARIQREGDPVKKAKYQIQLGRLKLQQALEAYSRNDVDHGQPLLDSYLEEMKGAWHTLENSGRPALKKPQGFRELDIALREDGRFLKDLEQRTPYMDRDPVTKVAAAISKLHEQVLEALFPPTKTQTSRQHVNSFPGLSISFDSERARAWGVFVVQA